MVEHCLPLEGGHAAQRSGGFDSFSDGGIDGVGVG
jgi:hypothetical protein